MEWWKEREKEVKRNMGTVTQKQQKETNLFLNFFLWVFNAELN